MQIGANWVQSGVNGLRNGYFIAMDGGWALSVVVAHPFLTCTRELIEKRCSLPQPTILKGSRFMTGFLPDSARGKHSP